MLAAAVTFPLSFGWVRFESTRSAQELYEAYVFGIRVARFPVGPVFHERGLSGRGSGVVSTER